jgi:hypothetical protein
VKTAICIASGTSLTKEDVDYCKGKAFVYVINTTYKLAPWSDVLYACDEEWWDYHKPDFAGQKWTINEKAAEKYNLNLIKHDSCIKFGTEGIIATGNNSGFQAINLAYLHGYKKILLLGYDFKNSGQHWHGKHPAKLAQSQNFKLWLNKMNQAAPIMESLGIEVINCSRDSDINCFRKSVISNEIY